MTVQLKDLRPGDVVVVDSPARGLGAVGGWLVRLRSKLMRRPSLHDHICMFSHVDQEGHPRGLEGRPSGFGWVNMTKYLEDPKAISNSNQSMRTDNERKAVVRAAIQMVGIPYDWSAIMAFAVESLGESFYADEWPEDGLPAQGVCSSAIDALYEAVAWENPGGFRRTRGTDVDDWTTFILDNGYHVGQ